MITPTPGRIVWFWPDALEIEAVPVVHNDKKQPLAAMVAYVHNDRLVNLSVIDQEGQQFSVENVRLMQGDEACNVGGTYCEWMPFQKGQAKPKDPAYSITAQRMYEAHAKHGDLFKGVPKHWDHLEPDEQTAWIEAAKAA